MIRAWDPWSLVFQSASDLALYARSYLGISMDLPSDAIEGRAGERSIWWQWILFVLLIGILPCAVYLSHTVRLEDRVVLETQSRAPGEHSRHPRTLRSFVIPLPESRSSNGGYWSDLIKPLVTSPLITRAYRCSQHGSWSA